MYLLLDVRDLDTDQFNPRGGKTLNSSFVHRVLYHFVNPQDKGLAAGKKCSVQETSWILGV